MVFRGLTEGRNDGIFPDFYVMDDARLGYLPNWPDGIRQDGRQCALEAKCKRLCFVCVSTVTSIISPSSISTTNGKRVARVH